MIVIQVSELIGDQLHTYKTIDQTTQGKSFVLPLKIHTFGGLRGGSSWPSLLKKFAVRKTKSYRIFYNVTYH